MGKQRRAPSSNGWIHDNEGGYAPSYFKANLTISYKIIDQVKASIEVRNLFDEEFYGLARGNSIGDIDAYDPQSNFNPSGFVGAYFPQPGRTFMMHLIVDL